jgi:hypothetical protein
LIRKKKDLRLEKQNKKALKRKAESDQLEIELKLPKTLRTEFNFLKFPFFDLSKDSKRKRIKIEEWVDTKEGKFHIFWKVTRDIESQFPGDFEKRLHRAIEQVVNATPKPITNPLRLGSLRYIARLMGINPDSGKNREDIQKAFKNIVKASIEAEGTFQLKEGKNKHYIQDTFHLYERVVFTGEQLPDGKTADCVYLMLGSWYMNNINNNYVVPLDWHFYNELTGAITTRMYEYLSIYFYAAIERGSPYLDVRYSQICSYFPVKRQYPAWKARKQLKSAHDSLTASGYFANIEWLDTTEADDWLLRYLIGPRAREEYENNKQEIRQFGTLSKPVPIPERRRRSQINLFEDDKETQLTAELKQHNVSITKAVKKGVEEDPERVWRIIDHYHLEVAAGATIPDSGAWIAAAISNPEFQIRPDAKTPAEKAAERKSQEEKLKQQQLADAVRKEREAAEAQRIRQRMTVYETHWQSLSQQEQLEIADEIVRGMSDFHRETYVKIKRDGGNPLSNKLVEPEYTRIRNQVLEKRYPELEKQLAEI